MKRLRLLLGDQLNPDHPWFDSVCDDTTYLLAEVWEEATYVRHHRQKVAGIFCAMSHFAGNLRAAGHQVLHLDLDVTRKHPDFTTLLTQLVSEHGFQGVEYQRPDEYRLMIQLRGLELKNAKVVEADTEHFLVPFGELEQHFQPGRSSRMESFYRRMRRKTGLLMTEGQPEGGQWNYDTANRKRLKPQDLELIPQPLKFDDDVSAVLDRIDRHQVPTLGSCERRLAWPVNRDQSLALLESFCRNGLCHFGTFQDAMTHRHRHAWSLFHSRLSFSLNLKMLHPMEVMQAAVAAYRDNPAVSIEQVEGFVRQILGWREFMRGIYWINMPDYASCNALAADRPLPRFFWTGDTEMNCLTQAIGQSLDRGYAHHIQRLMITGNFCLIAGINPDEVDAWYLGIYVDAFEWVEMPNTRGMSQFADGGIVGSKPYAAGGNYVSRMSDYCEGCRYDVKQKTGAGACPLNALYWHFMVRHRERLERNPRVAMIYRNWDRQEIETRRLVLERAEGFLADLT